MDAFNNNGLVVGGCFDAGDICFAVIWVDPGATGLKSLLSAGLSPMSTPVTSLP